MPTVAFQGLLVRSDGRPLHVRGPRCESCRRKLDYEADGDPYLLAALQRGKLVEDLELTDLWAGAALEGADDPPGPWQF